MTEQNRGVSIKRGRLLSTKAVRRSMATLGTRLTSEFNERVKLRAETAKLFRKYHSPLVELISKDKRAAEAVSGFRRLHIATQARKSRAPRPPRVKEQFFTGSVGYNQVPPYDYEWTWNAVSGSPQANSEMADKNSGNMSIEVSTSNGSDKSSIDGATGVGFLFYPPGNGTLRIWSSPSYNYNCGTFCTEDNASGDVWIGLYAESYDVTGAPVANVLDQKSELWSDSSFWNGTGPQTGSSGGFGLSSPPIQVDMDHSYIIWVVAGGDVSGDGWGTFFGSGASANLSVTVPSIRWELG